MFFRRDKALLTVMDINRFQAIDNQVLNTKIAQELGDDPVGKKIADKLQAAFRIIQFVL